MESFFGPACGGAALIRFADQSAIFVQAFVFTCRIAASSSRKNRAPINTDDRRMGIRSDEGEMSPESDGQLQARAFVSWKSNRWVRFLGDEDGFGFFTGDRRRLVTMNEKAGFSAL
jgi:hypothetical protein